MFDIYLMELQSAGFTCTSCEGHASAWTHFRVMLSSYPKINTWSPCKHLIALTEIWQHDCKDPNQQHIIAWLYWFATEPSEVQCLEQVGS